jgi:hypothetical protein
VHLVTKVSLHCGICIKIFIFWHPIGPISRKNFPSQNGHFLTQKPVSDKAFAEMFCQSEAAWSIVNFKNSVKLTVGFSPYGQRLQAENNGKISEENFCLVGWWGKGGYPDRPVLADNRRWSGEFTVLLNMLQDIGPQATHIQYLSMNTLQAPVGYQKLMLLLVLVPVMSGDIPMKIWEGGGEYCQFRKLTLAKYPQT